MTQRNVETQENGSTKVAIAAVIYGIISVFAGSFGVVAWITGLTILGVSLVLSGIALFGWSCFVRSWFFRTKR